MQLVSLEKVSRIRVLRVFSDNFSGILFTPEAYEELRCQMSSGDFGMHTTNVEYVDDYSGVITLTDLNNDGDMYFDYTAPIEESKTSTIDNIIHVDFVRKCRIV